MVAYRELRELETEALRRLRDKQKRSRQMSVNIALEVKLDVGQFYGIELEEFPAKIARTALYLMDHLANRQVSSEFGQSPGPCRPVPRNVALTCGKTLV